MAEPGYILIADDERIFREATAELIRDRGHRCDCAPDGTVAARMLREAAYDLLIVDLQMPGNEQFGLLHSLSGSTEAPSVLIVTGYPTLDTAIESHQFHVMGYLVKPFDLGKFFDLVESGVSRTRHRRLLHGSRLRVQQLAEDLGEIERISRDDGDVAGGARSYLELTLANILGSLQDLHRMASASDEDSGAERETPMSRAARRRRPADLEQAIRETITVLEGTKTAFKSKDLGELRHRLEAVLRHDPAATATATGPASG